MPAGFTPPTAHPSPCYADKFCKSCQDGYSPSANFVACVEDCNVSNCSQCVAGSRGRVCARCHATVPEAGAYFEIHFAIGEAPGLSLVFGLCPSCIVRENLVVEP